METTIQNPDSNQETSIEFMIPFYRNAHFLKKTVESVLRQTKINWRATVFDDCGGETEQAQKIVSDLKDPRFSFQTSESSLGIAGNWNRCIDNATAPYVVILHADDELAPEYANKMVELLNQYPEKAFAFCGAEIINQNGKRIFSLGDWIKRFLVPPFDKKGHVQISGELGLQSLLRGNYIFCPSITYRSKIVQTYKFDTKYGMVLDLDLYCRMIFDGLSFVGTRDSLFLYRRHLANATVEHTKTSKRFIEEISIYLKIAERARKFNWKKAAATGEAYLILKLNILFCVLGDILSARWKQSLVKLQLLGKNFESAK